MSELLCPQMKALQEAVNACRYRGPKGDRAMSNRYHWPMNNNEAEAIVQAALSLVVAIEPRAQPIAPAPGVGEAGRTANERLDWLLSCSAGEFERINDLRLSVARVHVLKEIDSSINAAMNPESEAKK